MNALAFDTATAACSVALRRADGAEFTHAPPASRMFEQPAHTTELLPAIEQLLAEAELKLAQIETLAVGIGPGAFTGLRIGVATARAIATANGIGIAPVSSLAALERGALGDHTPLPVIDARRKEFFHRIEGEDRLAGPDETVAAAQPGMFAIGDGAVKLREQLEAAGVTVANDDDPRHVVSGLALLDLAIEIAPAQPDEVTPNYIRAPDAKVSTRESWLVAAR